MTSAARSINAVRRAVLRAFPTAHREARDSSATCRIRPPSMILARRRQRSVGGWSRGSCRRLASSCAGEARCPSRDSAYCRAPDDLFPTLERLHADDLPLGTLPTGRCDRTRDRGLELARRFRRDPHFRRRRHPRADPEILRRGSRASTSPRPRRYVERQSGGDSRSQAATCGRSWLVTPTTAAARRRATADTLARFRRSSRR